MIVETYQCECPNCGGKINVYIKSDGSIAIGFFDIQNNCDSIILVKNPIEQAIDLKSEEGG